MNNARIKRTPAKILISDALVFFRFFAYVSLKFRLVKMTKNKGQKKVALYFFVKKHENGYIYKTFTQY